MASLPPTQAQLDLSYAILTLDSYNRKHRLGSGLVGDRRDYNTGVEVDH